MSKYGTCARCGGDLSPVFFTEEEEILEGSPGARYLSKTGRIRRAVDYLVCDYCGHKEAVDDTFDGPWHY